MSNGAVNIKEPLVSGILSLIIPGIGQAYNGQIKKGISIFIGQLIAWILLWVLFFFGGMIIAFLSMGIGLFCCLPFMFLPFLINIWAAYDAYKAANVINSGGFIRDWFT